MPTGVYVRTDEHRAAMKKAQNAPGMKEKQSAIMIEVNKRPGMKEKKSAVMIERYSDPAEREKRSVVQKEVSKRPGMKEKQSVTSKEVSKRPGMKEKRSAIMRERYSDPAEREKQSVTSKEVNKRPGMREKLSVIQKIAQNKPGMRERKSAAQKKVYEDPEMRMKKSVAMKKVMNDPEVKMRWKETFVGGFCIQNIIYDEREGYCEVWGPGLWRRIDAYQDNKSIISGKTKEDNNGKELTRHHLYWQKKACCGYDEDTKGYYAMINLGTRGKSEIHKHYIKGSPNKFVLLTSHEHGIIKGNKKLGTNKLTWIKVLEDLVETKLNGKTFYTESEYANLEV